MSTDPYFQAREALRQARQALRTGNRREARRYAEFAAFLAPDLEEPWLLLAAVASPRASLEYLKRALQINPESQVARQGFDWAIHRQNQESSSGSTQPVKISRPAPAAHRNVPEESLVRPRRPIFAWVIALAIIVLAGSAWVGTPLMRRVLASGRPASPRACAALDRPTRTPTNTPTSTPTPTPTNTPTPTPTPTSTPTSTPTNTPTNTPTPEPTATPEPDEIAIPDVGEDERWIDIDLTNQRAYAMVGDQMANAFIVSTGTWAHPTVTGQFNIYVKYRYADMSGPGYYLPDVPYVMYFYDGYGLHGTYWHNNFGTPMSHGCVNFTIDDAGWVYNFSSIGTLVNVHY